MKWRASPFIGRGANRAGNFSCKLNQTQRNAQPVYCEAEQTGESRWRESRGLAAAAIGRISAALAKSRAIRFTVY